MILGTYMFSFSHRSIFVHVLCACRLSNFACVSHNLQSIQANTIIKSYSAGRHFTMWGKYLLLFLQNKVNVCWRENRWEVYWLDLALVITQRSMYSAEQKKKKNSIEHQMKRSCNSRPQFYISCENLTNRISERPDNLCIPVKSHHS